MTGLRKEIAKHVVLNILETLGQDDFVAIYKFSKYPTPLVPCFTTEDGELTKEIKPDQRDDTIDLALSSNIIDLKIGRT